MIISSKITYLFGPVFFNVFQNTHNHILCLNHRSYQCNVENKTTDLSKYS